MNKYAFTLTSSERFESIGGIPGSTDDQRRQLQLTEVLPRVQYENSPIRVVLVDAIAYYLLTDHRIVR